MIAYDYLIIDYLNNAPDTDTLKSICSMLNCSAEQLVRKKEALYKELSIEASRMTEADWLQLLSSYPRLIERPIVIQGEEARVGRPPEQILELIN